MKITGAEFIDWYDNHWPFEGDDWYHEDGEIRTHRDDGEWALDPTRTYDADDLGSVHYQGRGENPTGGDGYAVSTLIKRWRKARDFTVVAVEIPKGQKSQIRATLATLGVKVVGG